MKARIGSARRRRPVLVGVSVSDGPPTSGAVSATAFRSKLFLGRRLVEVATHAVLGDAEGYHIEERLKGRRRSSQSRMRSKVVVRGRRSNSLHRVADAGKFHPRREKGVPVKRYRGPGTGTGAVAYGHPARQWDQAPADTGVKKIGTSASKLCFTTTPRVREPDAGHRHGDDPLPVGGAS